MPIKHYVFQSKVTEPLRRIRSRLMNEALTRAPTPSGTQLLEDHLKAWRAKESGSDASDQRTPPRYSEEFSLLYSNLDINLYDILELVVRGSKEDFDILDPRIAAPDIELLRLGDVTTAVYNFTVQPRTCKSGLVNGYEKMVRRTCPGIELDIMHYLTWFENDRYKISCTGPVENVLLVREMTRSNGNPIEVKKESISFLTAVPKSG